MRIIGLVGLVLCLAVGAVQAAEKDKKAKAPANAQAKQEASNLFAQGFQAYQAGNLSIAQELFENGLKKFPNDASALYFLAEILRKQGEFDRARQLYEQSLKLEPGGRYAIPAQGALMDLGEEKRTSQKKAAGKRLFAEAYDLLQAEKFEAARDKFGEGLKLDEDPKARELFEKADKAVKLGPAWLKAAPYLKSQGLPDTMIAELFKYPKKIKIMSKATTIKSESITYVGHYNRTTKSIAELAPGTVEGQVIMEVGNPDGSTSIHKSRGITAQGVIGFNPDRKKNLPPTQYLEYSIEGNPELERIGDTSKIHQKYIDYYYDDSKNQILETTYQSFDNTRTLEAVAIVSINGVSTPIHRVKSTMFMDYSYRNMSTDTIVAQHKGASSYTFIEIPAFGVTGMVSQSLPHNGASLDQSWKVTLESVDGVKVNIVLNDQFK